MSANVLRFSVRLVDPGGAVHDITDRTFAGSVGSLSESLEDDLVQFTHDDIELDLDDRDGYVTHLLRFAQPADTWELWIDRETGYRRPRYRREFGGVLDVPWSIRSTPADQTVSVRAFAYSKLLERASAETIMRTVTGRTGSASSGGTTATLSSTTDLHRGDEIALDNGAEREVRTVESVDSATVVTITETWSNSFDADSTMELDTPFYRNKTATWLAAQLLTTGGIESHSIDLSQSLVAFPFGSPLNDHDIPGGAVPTGITVVGGEVGVYVGGDRFTAANLTDGFTDDGVHASAGDWTPYVDTEPGSLETGTDDGTRAWDHTGGFVYSLKVTLVVSTSSKLELEQDGVVVKLIDNYLSDDGYPKQSIEFDPTTGDVVIGFRRGNGSSEATRAYETAGWTVTTAISTSVFYELRAIARLGWLALYDPDAGTLDMRSLAAGYASERLLTPPGSLYTWSLRAMTGHLVALYRDGATTAVRVWDTATYAATDYPIAPSTSARQYLTRWTDADGVEIVVGYAGGEYFALSDRFEGVIPYADFDGLSCAGALTELAKASMAYFDVGPSRHGTVRGRAYEATSLGEPVELPVPLDRTDLQMWQDYSTSVVAMGTDRNGDDIERIAGDTGDSSRRAEVDSKLIQTAATAVAVASKYYAWLSRERKESDVTVDETEPRARPLDIRRMGGVTYQVIGADTELEAREQSLRLVEV